MRKSPLLPIYIVLFADNFGFALAFTLFARLILSTDFQMVTHATSLAEKNLWLSLLFVAFPFAQFFGAPILGDLADHQGRKKALSITMLGTVIGYALSAISIDYHHLLLLIFSRLIAGFFAGNASICFATIADLIPDERQRSKYYGVAEIFPVFGWILAMIAGGIDWSPCIPFWISAALSLISFFVLIFMFQETNNQTQKDRFSLFSGMQHIVTAFTDFRTCWYYLTFFFWIIGWGIVDQWFAAISLEKFLPNASSITFWLVISGIAWGLGGLVINFFY